MAEASRGQDGRVPPGAQVGKGLMPAQSLGGKPHLCYVRPLMGSVGDSADDNLTEWTEPRWRSGRRSPGLTAHDLAVHT